MTRSLRIVALVLVAVSLAACAARPGTAAVVGERRISVSELERVRDDIARLDPNVSFAEVLAVLVAAPVVIRVASDNGVGVSDDEAREELASSTVQVGDGHASDWGPGAITLVRAVLANQRIAGLSNATEVSDGMRAELAALDITINPRYGDGFNASTFAITPTSLPWIADTPR